jgi:Ca2+-binding RTX toxin-like protein
VRKWIRPAHVLGAVALAAPLALLAPPAHADVECDGHAATIVGTAGPDDLVGTPQNDVIAGLDGWDTIDGRGGADVICGDDGRDHLHGGRGDDRLYGGLDGLSTDRGDEPVVVGDVVYGGPGDDLFDGGLDDRARVQRPDEISYATAGRRVSASLATLSARGQGRDRFTAQTWRLVGSPYGDYLEGTALADVIEGGGGDDLLNGRAGDDVLTPDNRRGPQDADIVRAGPGDDRVQSFAGRDRVFGGGGADGLYDWGARGADRLVGGPGDDYLLDVLVDRARQGVTGGAGDDYVYLSSRIRRHGHPVRLHGTADLRDGTATLVWRGGHRSFRLASAESLSVPAGAWTAYGTDAANRLETSGTGPLRLFGRAGDDLLLGSARDDVIDGGAGEDTARPRTGKDTCTHVEKPGRCEVLR